MTVLNMAPKFLDTLLIKGGGGGVYVYSPCIWTGCTASTNKEWQRQSCMTSQTQSQATQLLHCSMEHLYVDPQTAAQEPNDSTAVMFCRSQSTRRGHGRRFGLKSKSLILVLVPDMWINEPSRSFKSPATDSPLTLPS